MPLATARTVSVGRAGAAALACALVASAWCADPGAPRQDVAVTAHHVAGPVHFLEARGAGNVGVSAGPDGILMIDDQFANRAPQIRAALAAIQEGPVDFVINTHYHGDHTNGNTVFGETASILAHDNVRARLLQPDARTGQPMAAVGLPVVTYPQQVSVHFNGEELRIEHFPTSHTDGDSVVWFTGTNAVHMGDLFFVDRFPYVDLDAGGSVGGLIASLEAILARVGDDTRIIPGHGPLAKKADLARYRDMLVDTRAKVAEAVAAGATAEQIRADGLLAEYADWGAGFINMERWVDTLVREASR